MGLRTYFVGLLWGLNDKMIYIFTCTYTCFIYNTIYLTVDIPGSSLSRYMLHTHTHTHLLDSKVSETNLSSLPLHFQAFIFADVYLSPIVYIHTSADIWNVFPLAFYFSFLSSLVETLVKSFLKATVLVQFMLFSL